MNKHSFDDVVESKRSSLSRKVKCQGVNNFSTRHKKKGSHEILESDTMSEILNNISWRDIGVNFVYSLGVSCSSRL